MKVQGKINWNQIIIVLLIGFAFGAAFGKWYEKDHYHKHWKKGDIKQHMLERFNKNLHLTDEQQKQVAAIFDAKHPQMLAIQAEVKPKFEAIRNSTQNEIRKVLNSDQQTKFDEMNAKMVERWKQREKFLDS